MKTFSPESERIDEEKQRNVKRLIKFQHRFHQLKNRWPAVYPCNVTLPKPSTQPGA